MFVFKFDTFAEGFSWVGSVSAPVIAGIIIAYILNPLVNIIEQKLFKKVREGKPDKEGIVMQQFHKTPVGKAKIVKTIEKRSSKTREEKIKARRGLARGLSILITYLIVVAALVGICLAVVPSVSKSVVDLADQMPGYLDRANAWLQQIFANNPELAEYIEGEFSDMADIVNRLVGMVKPVAGDIVGSVGSGLFKFAGALFTGIKNILIGFIIAIYLLYSKEHMLAQVKKIFVAFFKPERCRRIFTTLNKANRIFKQYIISNLLDSLLVFLFMTIGMLVMGMPYPMLISVVCGVTNLIPFFGPFIGAIPCGLLILLADPLKVIWFAIFVLILQQLDGNVIKPLLFGESVGLPAIWVLVSIIVGGGIFGIPGMLLGVPVFAVFYLLFAEYVSDKLKKKSLPHDTLDYERSTEDFAEQYLHPKENAGDLSEQ